MTFTISCIILTDLYQGQMDKKVISDAKSALIQDAAEKGLKITVCCPSHNKATQMCCNRQCETSFFCQEEDCNCINKHILCGMNLSFNKLKAKLSLISTERKRVIISLKEIDQDFKQEITKSLEELNRECSAHCLEDKEQAIIDKVLQGVDQENITGKQAADLCQEIDNRIKNYPTAVKEKIKWYKERTAELIEQARKLKQEMKECMQNNSIKFESAILKKTRDSDKIQYLLKALSETKPIKAIELLFRGSRDGFASTTFHQKCDNKYNTVTIVRTEHKRTIAGYAFYRWNEASSNYYSNVGKQSYLLQLDIKQKYIPVSDKNLIICSNGYGPTFGGGHDLYISNNCDTNSYSHCNFPTSYNGEGPHRYDNNQNSYQVICGATNGCKFKVIDYEVFQVIYDQ